MPFEPQVYIFMPWEFNALLRLFILFNAAHGVFKSNEVQTRIFNLKILPDMYKLNHI